MDSHDAAIAADVETILALKPFFLQHFKPRILIHIIANLPHHYYKKSPKLSDKRKHFKHHKNCEEGVYRD